MLRSAAHLHNYKINAKDGQLGILSDLYFDDRTWQVKYLIIDTGIWLPGKEVLVDPELFGQADYENKLIDVDLTNS